MKVSSSSTANFSAHNSSFLPTDGACNAILCLCASPLSAIWVIPDSLGNPLQGPSRFMADAASDPSKLIMTLLSCDEDLVPQEARVASKGFRSFDQLGVDGVARLVNSDFARGSFAIKTIAEYNWIVVGKICGHTHRACHIIGINRILNLRAPVDRCIREVVFLHLHRGVNQLVGRCGGWSILGRIIGG